MSANPAEFLGIQIPTLALGVSLLSFSAAAFSLGWQIVKHVLDGGRVRVYLNAGILSENSIVVNDTGKWDTPYPFDGGPPSANIEVAQLVIENPGRSSITIYNPALDISGVKEGHYSVGPSTFEFDADDTISTKSLFRLEPYSRVTYLLDYWRVIPSLRGEAAGGTIRLRGMVRVAGRRKPQKSSRRRAWKIPNEAWSSRAGATEVDAYTVMWRELYREYRTSGASRVDEGEVSFGRLQMILHRARMALTEMPDVDQLEEVLKSSSDTLRIPQPYFGWIAFNMHRALKSHEPHLAAWIREGSSVATPRPEVPESDD
ncbi:hypothetical protein ACFYM0_14765 [Streptomyces sp. NPDC006487]|uniref:hypothetical protein n=1 Tax=Streptomyces sp. NPDC006487 TaxID=3364748 RepID=UPI00368A8B09